MSDIAELMKRCQRGVGGRNALDEAHDIMAECYGTLGRLESEVHTLRQQRDKLAKVLGNVDREHDLIRQMKNCEIRRGRGSFGIAVMSDPLALEWQALDKALQQLIDARRAAISELTP